MCAPHCVTSWVKMSSQHILGTFVLWHLSYVRKVALLTLLTCKYKFIVYLLFTSHRTKAYIWIELKKKLFNMSFLHTVSFKITFRQVNISTGCKQLLIFHWCTWEEILARYLGAPSQMTSWVRVSSHENFFIWF